MHHLLRNTNWPVIIGRCGLDHRDQMLMQTSLFSIFWKKFPFVFSISVFFFVIVSVSSSPHFNNGNGMTGKSLSRDNDIKNVRFHLANVLSRFQSSTGWSFSYWTTWRKKFTKPDLTASLRLSNGSETSSSLSLMISFNGHEWLICISQKLVDLGPCRGVWGASWSYKTKL